MCMNYVYKYQCNIISSVYIRPYVCTCVYHLPGLHPVDVLEFLLYSGCSVNGKVAGGTALHYAASGGHVEAAKLLISSGVHINALVGTADEVMCYYL